MKTNACALFAFGMTLALGSTDAAAQAPQPGDEARGVRRLYEWMDEKEKK